jgi:hypothetical protein
MAAPVEYNRRNTFCDGSFGDKPPHRFCRFQIGSAPDGIRDGFIDSRRGRNGIAGFIVNYLRVDVFQAAKHGKPRTSWSTGEAFAQAAMTMYPHFVSAAIFNHTKSPRNLFAAGLTGFAYNMFIRVANALALIRFWRPESSDIGGCLPDGLFVRTPHNYLRRAVDGKLYPFGRRYLYGMGKPQRQDKVLSLHLGPVTDPDNFQNTFETSADPRHHIVQNGSRHAMRGTIVLFVVASRDNYAPVLQFNGNIGQHSELKRAFLTLYCNFPALYFHIDALRQ